eukprot:5361067-Amphidinium_carterae.1
MPKYVGSKARMWALTIWTCAPVPFQQTHATATSEGIPASNQLRGRVFSFGVESLSLVCDPPDDGYTVLGERNLSK